MEVTLNNAAYMHIYVELNNWKSKYKTAGKVKWAKLVYIENRDGQRKLVEALKRLTFKEEKSMCLNSRHEFFKSQNQILKKDQQELEVQPSTKYHESTELRDVKTVIHCK